MSLIRVLPDEVASQIAAGEVVERPASAVKELLENALDANPHQITIHIEKAGQRLIEVADDGSGILEEEILLAVARHATSKLRSAEDLFHIATLGFRGEALASIASVSHLTLTSRPAQSLTGAQVRVEGGSTGRLEKIGAPAGTVVRVEDLFYNVPARLKFLKKENTERQQIDALVTRYALAYPQVRFQLFHEQQAALQTSGNGNRREILASLYGVETARQMLEVIMEEDDLRLTGFTSPISVTRSNRREITFFVNGRWVQDSALAAALLQAYHTLLMVGRYPQCVLFLEIPPEEVDVNVHPAKAEVRFRSSDRIFSAVQRGVRRALLSSSMAPAVTSTTWKNTGTIFHPFPDSPLPAEDFPSEQPLPLIHFPPTSTDFPTSSENPPPQAETAYPPQPSGQIPLLRLVGQIGGTYLVAEGPDGLYLIDQHAAHERVLFEKLLHSLKNQVPSQALLTPAVVTLPPQSAAALQEQLPLLDALGFQVESFGPTAFRVLALPSLLARMDPGAALRVVVEDFEENEEPLQAEKEARLAARICKRAAVKGGQNLSFEEQSALLRDLEACSQPRTCPHGRPTMIHLSVDLLERQFGRRGSR